MTLRRLFVAMLWAALLGGACLSGRTVMAQATGANEQKQDEQKQEDHANLDTQLYLIVATNQEVAESRSPAILEPVLKQLRATLPFKNYRVSATLINRVKNDGRLNLKWIGGPLIVSAAATTHTPSFNEFKVHNVRLLQDGNRQVVRMEGFSFGARIPIQSGTAIAASGPAAPIINYESTGLNTDISMREGEPVVVGTLNVGPSGDAIILVISAKRTGN
jgi:hypothetical protein